MDFVAEHDRTIRERREALERSGSPEAARALAEAHLERAQYLHVFVAVEPSLEGYRQAIALFETLPDGTLATARTRGELGSALRDLGRLHEALAEHDRAIDALEAAPGAAQPDHLSELGRARLDRGGILEGLGLSTGALAEYRTAVAILEPLLQAEPTDDRARDLAAAHGTFAALLASLGRHGEALVHHEREIELVTADDDPLDRPRARCRKAASLHALGRFDETEAELARAVVELEDAVAFERGTNDALRKLGGDCRAPATDVTAGARLARAAALAALARRDEAREEAAAAVALWQRSMDEGMGYVAAALAEALAMLERLDLGDWPARAQ